MIAYRVIRSDRKTMVLQVNAEGVTVRAPLRFDDARIRRFVEEHTDWIEQKLQKHRSMGAVPRLSTAELYALAEQALKDLPPRVAHYAALLGVTYGKITVRNQKTRWGSCSSSGNLNFNCLLMLTPPEVRDYIVVHELCHRKEMNHSKRFYAEVARVMPDYRRQVQWLKEHGGEIMARMTGVGCNEDHGTD